MSTLSNEPLVRLDQLLRGFDRGEYNVQTVAEEIAELWPRLGELARIRANRWILEHVEDDN